MIVYKALQIVSVAKLEPKAWDQNNRSGVTHAANMACIGTDGGVASIRLKCKSAEELIAKIAKYNIGKPAEVPLTEIVPVFRKDRDGGAVSYQLTS